MNSNTLILNEIDISSLLKAMGKFNDFRQHTNSEQEKAGVVQAYEYCFELSWKMLKRVLTQRGTIVASPRDVFREGASNGLIDEPESWFEFMRLRNLTSHVYNEKYMKEILNSAEKFSIAMNTLVTRFQALK